MNLIIFDIDGTLTQTYTVDTKCFTQAVKDITHIDNLNTNWSSYQYSTDSGLLKEIYATHFQRAPSEDEVNKIRDRFVEYLKDEWLHDKLLYSPVPGAERVFQDIATLANWHIAIATGGWKKSALFKLESATIPHADLPKAFADDHFERTDIIKTAIKNSEFLHGINHYKHIIYVGDKSWDERAATALNLGFVGVGQEFQGSRPQPQRLFIQNYEILTPLLNFLETIQAPVLVT